MLNGKVIMRRNTNIVRRDIGDETVLVPVLKTNKEMSCIYTLNKPAARVWDMLDGKTDLAKVKERILKEFDVTSAEMNRALERLFKDLCESGAICK